MHHSELGRDVVILITSWERKTRRVRPDIARSHRADSSGRLFYLIVRELHQHVRPEDLQLPIGRPSRAKSQIRAICPKDPAEASPAGTPNASPKFGVPRPALVVKLGKKAGVPKITNDKKKTLTTTADLLLGLGVGPGGASSQQPPLSASPPSIRWGQLHQQSTLNKLLGQVGKLPVLPVSAVEKSPTGSEEEYEEIDNWDPADGRDPFSGRIRRGIGGTIWSRRILLVSRGSFNEGSIRETERRPQVASRSRGYFYGSRENI